MNDKFGDCILLAFVSHRLRDLIVLNQRKKQLDKLIAIWRSYCIQDFPYEISETKQIIQIKIVNFQRPSSYLIKDMSVSEFSKQITMYLTTGIT